MNRYVAVPVEGPYPTRSNPHATPRLWNVNDCDTDRFVFATPTHSETAARREADRLNAMKG